MTRAHKLLEKVVREGAGAFIVFEDLGLLLQRCERCSFPLTWAPPGGVIDPGEDAYAAAVRETYEEASVDIANEVVRQKVVQQLTNEPGSYTTFVYYLDYQPVVQIDHESIDWGWFTRTDMKDMNLHPGVYTLLDQVGYF